jgi:hypothetical protein
VYVHTLYYFVSYFLMIVLLIFACVGYVVLILDAFIYKELLLYLQ